eukprot:16444843-Heterocapsa_arctica.AAC.1
MKSLKPVKTMDGERLRSGGVQVQVIVQHGHVQIYSTEEGRVTDHQPVICRPMLLAQQTADGILEALSKAMPFFVDEPAALLRMLETCDALVLGMACDRASANFRLVYWMWTKLEDPAMPRAVVPWLEPCWAHGVHLVKSRPRIGKPLINALQTFSACMRQWRFTNALRDAMVIFIRSKIEIVRATRPAADIDESMKLLKLVYPIDDEGSFLYRDGADGRRVKTPLCEDLESIVQGISLLPLEDGKIKHYCFVQAGSAEHKGGQQVGAPCCECFDDSLGKVCVPLLNFLCHRAWDRSNAARWTYVVQQLKKVCVGYLAARVLPESLSQLKALWDLRAVGLEAILEALVRADEQDYSAKSKLRLLRVCKVFCLPTAGWQLAIQLLALEQVDPLLYDLLGERAGHRDRARLADLISSPGSKLAQTQGRLLGLLGNWAPSNPKLCLFSALGGHFNDPEAKTYTSQLVLQLNASLHDHFASRMSKPPYSLFQLLDPQLIPEHRDRIVAEFFAVPS